MKTEDFVLDEARKVSLRVYLWEDSQEFQTGLERPMVIVCPGGGYTFLSDREADTIALQYLAAGFHAAILKYGILEHAVAPGPLRDAADAVAFVRDHAKEWLVSYEDVFISGFSAGGHVAGQLGVFWNHKDLLPKYQDNPKKVKPKGLILCYPVLDLRGSSRRMDVGAKPGDTPEKLAVERGVHPKATPETVFFLDEKEKRYFQNFEVYMNNYIFGGDYTDEQEDFYSLQNQVTEDTPDTFLWHCCGDDLIDVSNSLEFATALHSHGVDTELHIYSDGAHGISNANYLAAGAKEQIHPQTEGWLPLAINWVRRKSGFNEKVEALF